MAKRVKKEKVVYPECVRHKKTRKDVRLRHFFLCDACTKKWTAEAFDGNKPLYVGESVEGYCSLCNKQSTAIKLRTWFLCDVCHRVAGSIGRNHVAEQAILDFWEEKIRPQHPTLVIVQNDKSALHPRRDTDLSGEAPIDFLVKDKKNGEVVFAIENKTGRSSMSDMSQFQLDVSDCDTILNDMKKLNTPAFVVHAQVLEIWQPPSHGYKIAGLWWSDVYVMRDHFKSVRQRRDEMRGAAYFGKKAFKSMDTFADELMDGKDFAIVKRFKKEGIPQMYAAGS